MDRSRMQSKRPRATQVVAALGAVLLGTVVSSAAGCSTDSRRGDTESSRQPSRAIAPHVSVPFDLDDALRRARAMFRVDAGGYSARGSDLSATVDRRGELAISAHRDRNWAPLGRVEPRAAAATFSTMCIDCGSAEPRSDVHESSIAGGVVSLARGAGVVEQFESLAHAVEQRWRFEFRGAVPREGDLVVRVRASGARIDRAVPDALHFKGSRGEHIRYSKAAWVDARGERTPVAMAFNGGAIELRVAAQVLAESAYPAVLDPLIDSTETAIDPTTDRPEPAGGTQQYASVASDGTNHFVVWQDSRDDAHGLAIYGARVNSSGTVLSNDRGGLPIAAGLSNAVLPQVAFDGTSFIVAWQDDRNGTNWDLYARRVSTAGVMDPGVTQLTSSAGDEVAPSIACATGSCLIAYQSGLGTSLGAKAQVSSMLLTSSATIALSTPVVVANGAADEIAPRVAYSATEAGYLVVWQDARNSAPPNDFDVFARRVGADGQVAVAAAFAVASSGDSETSPRVAAGTSSLFVGYNRTIANPDGGARQSEVYLAQLSAGSSTPTSVANLSQDADADDFLGGMANAVGTDTYLAWAKQPIGSPISYPHVERLAASNGGSVGSQANTDKAMLTSDTPTIGVAPNGIYVASNTLADNANAPLAYFLTNLNLTTSVGAFRVSTGNSELTPRVATNGTNYLVVWSDDREEPKFTSAPGSEIFAASVSANGSISTVFKVAGDPAARAFQRRPDLAWDSKNSAYLVVWDETNIADSDAHDIYAARVTSASAVPMPVSQASRDQIGPRVACGPTDCVAAWTDDRHSSSSFHNVDVYGARIADATITPLTIASEPGDQTRPNIASDGVDYVVVYETPGNPDTDVDAVARWIHASSVGSPFVVSSVKATPQRAPAVACRAVADCVAVWTDMRGSRTLASDLFAVHMNGLDALPSSEVVVSSAASVKHAPQIGYDGASYFVVWSDARSGAYDDVYGTWLDAKGSPRIAHDVPIAAETEQKATPSLASVSMGRSLVTYARLDLAHPDARNYRARARLVTALPNGEHCSLADQCLSGYCDSVCADRPDAGIVDASVPIDAAPVVPLPDAQALDAWATDANEHVSPTDAADGGAAADSASPPVDKSDAASDASSGPTGPSSNGPDAVSHDAAAAEPTRSGAATPDDSDCGCRIVGGANRSMGAGAVSLLLAVGVALRRRARAGRTVR